MSKILDEFLTSNLNELEEKGLLTTIDVLEDHGNGPIIQIEGKELINFASNNYLGFATREELIEADIAATKKYGVGAGAVRTINGTLDIHRDLVKKIAEFKGTDDAIAFQSGFNGNMGVIPVVMTNGDAILSDELSHASII